MEQRHMRGEVYMASAGVYGGRVYVVGGCDDEGRPTVSTQRYTFVYRYVYTCMCCLLMFSCHIFHDIQSNASFCIHEQISAIDFN
jgi:hypothetical protein